MKSASSMHYECQNCDYNQNQRAFSCQHAHAHAGKSTPAPALVGNSNMETGKFKTKLCHHFMTTGTCYYGTKCHFAHGEHQLRRTADSGPLIHPRHKTTLCQNELRHGSCKFGKACMFIHTSDPEYKTLQETMVKHQKVCQFSPTKQPNQEQFWSSQQERSQEQVWNSQQQQRGQEQIWSAQKQQLSQERLWSPAQTQPVSDPVDLTTHETSSDKSQVSVLGLFLPLKQVLSEVQEPTNFIPGTPLTVRKHSSYDDRRTSAASVWGTLSPRVAVWEKRLRRTSRSLMV